MAKAAAQPVTAADIVDAIRGAHWVTRDEAIEVIERFAAVAAAEAAIKATNEAFAKCIAITAESLSEPLMTVNAAIACNAQIPDSNNRCTRDAGHPGDHRCLAIDVDRRKRAYA